MKVIESLKKCPYFVEIKEYDRGNGNIYFVYIFRKGNGFMYYIYQDDNKYLNGLAYDVENNKKTWNEIEYWFKELYLNTLKKESERKRIRRLVENEKEEVLDIIFHYTGLEEEGRELYECYRKTKQLYTKEKRIAEILQEELKKERYEVEMIKKEDVYHIIVKDDEKNENET
jgi:hypothetical protein